MGICILQDSSCHKYVLVLMCNVNKAHDLLFIFTQSFTIDYMSRDLWHHNGQPYSLAAYNPST